MISAMAAQLTPRPQPACILRCQLRAWAIFASFSSCFSSASGLGSASSAARFDSAAATPPPPPPETTVSTPAGGSESRSAAVVAGESGASSSPWIQAKRHRMRANTWAARTKTTSSTGMQARINTQLRRDRGASGRRPVNRRQRTEDKPRASQALGGRRETSKHPPFRAVRGGVCARHTLRSGSPPTQLESVEMRAQRRAERQGKQDSDVSQR